MAVQRIYRCNLCQGSDESRLTGIFWTFVKNYTKEGERFVEKPYRDVEHHLCDKCLQDAHDIWAEQHP